MTDSKTAAAIDRVLAIDGLIRDRYLWPHDDDLRRELERMLAGHAAALAQAVREHTWQQAREACASVLDEAFNVSGDPDLTNLAKAIRALKRPEVK